MRTRLPQRGPGEVALLERDDKQQAERCVILLTGMAQGSNRTSSVGIFVALRERSLLGRLKQRQTRTSMSWQCAVQRTLPNI